MSPTPKSVDKASDVECSRVDTSDDGEGGQIDISGRPERPDDWHLRLGDPPDIEGRIVLREKSFRGRGVAIALDKGDGGYILRAKSHDDGGSAKASWSCFDGDPIDHEEWISEDQWKSMSLDHLARRVFNARGGEKSDVRKVIKQQAKAFEPMDLRQDPDGTVEVRRGKRTWFFSFASGQRQAVELISLLMRENAFYARRVKELSAGNSKGGKAKRYFVSGKEEDRIRPLIAKGLQTREIVEATGASKSYVNKVKRKMSTP